MTIQVYISWSCHRIARKRSNCAANAIFVPQEIAGPKNTVVS